MEGSMISPYYQDSAVTIYHGDAREIVPSLEPVDLVLTDPPYPRTKEAEYRYRPDGLEFLDLLNCRQFIFWTPSTPFPLSYSGKRIWDKAVGTNTQFEEIYERHNSSGYKIHRFVMPNNAVSAAFAGDVYYQHGHQKPLRLIIKLLGETNTRVVLDPFMGSGTTLRAAKDLGLQAIGIDIEEWCCEMAAKRMAQEVLEFA